MSYRRLVIVLAVVCVSCKQPARPQAGRPAAAGGPQIEATVVTIRTTVQPGGSTQDHTLIIAGDRARSTSERDVWRVFDTGASTVTTVDEISRTVRTEPLPVLMRRRRTAANSALPAHYPRLRMQKTGEKRPILGATAEQSVIRSGEYRRELWLADHPSIPDGLFAMMIASEPPSSPLAPMTRAIDEALMSTKEFPLLDRAEVPLEKEKLIVERTVTAIARRRVPEAMLTPPRAYLDLTPKEAQ